MIAFVLLLPSDIDECATDENRCNQKCNNTEGSYLCSCVDGFRLDTDNVTCIGRNSSEDTAASPGGHSHIWAV